jgi:hypothetical protein
MPFQPGNKLGKGRPKLPSDVKEARQFSKSEVDHSLSKFVVMTRDDLAKVKNDPESTLLDLALHSIFTHAINKGDHQRLEFILNRTIGKVRENIHVDFIPIRVRVEERQYLLDAGSPSETG